MPKDAILPKRRRIAPSKGLVFISHDSRDHAIAEAFENLLRDASGGSLKTFRSSDKKGYSGIAFGAEWYTTLMERLGRATDVVALITPNSVDRPWILYEVGVARGRTGVTAFGVAIAVPFEQVGGPFAQFQNSSDDEESLTKLVMQLMARVPEASPRLEAIRLHVNNFRAIAVKHFREKQVAVVPVAVVPPPASTVLFEEVKAMFRVVADQLSILNRRVPDALSEMARAAEDVSPPAPAWAKDIDDLIDDLRLARTAERRLSLWKKLLAIISLRSSAHPQSLVAIRDAVRVNNRLAIKAGVAELRQVVKDQRRGASADKNEAYLYDTLRRLADVAEGWSH